ncbi:hypothetical protein B0A55_06063 [Friedmanniomyces simplex]|uniref:glucan 1,3-beta-glucosidase n=1 Tax=Friedmanniomyces simplex TaxID=329884 RepID=A0A4U0XDH5_9PEZI|nr:hypothetical protein B0A55_06063 [Friedmanniomyces simplex]
MSGIHSFAGLAVLALFASTIDALPQSFRHKRRQWESTATSYSTPTAGPTPTETGTSFASFSVEPSHSFLSRTAPYGFTASGFAAAPTDVPSPGQPYPTASSTASPGLNSSSPYPLNGTNSTSSISSQYPAKFRGVNLGSWLVLESWMTPDVFEGTNAIDQWTFDSTDGAEAKLQQHWSTYITEGDFKNMSSWGINAVRIPIGYWAYNNTGTPYITGADAYLEKAIGWARQYGIWVMVDCHGSPGSQNGAEHSGHTGDVAWQSDGIELVNEPKIGTDANSLSTTQKWAAQAYQAVKSKAENKDMYILHHDGFTGVQSWTAVGQVINNNASSSSSLSSSSSPSHQQGTFAIDIHLYQNQDAADEALTLPQHITKACAYTSTALLPLNSTLPVFVGEFSAQINIQNTTTADGTWSPTLIDGTRQFFEAQIDAFEHSSRGWFIWSLKQGADDGAWSLESIMRSVYGQGETVTSRKYPGICPFG